ncbi:hypothetical protein M011DRAFT_462229 [Sporormia fimetaria CBS 119925]|uniref:SH3 domain-containing protein n=1 Tax=Sporormia fimetaria CBS 119925 TaxID=1340428 RepID=A0A6A6UWL3_9PLEO|nr:hypothetical protein M011DRAFT_462229 [Sporormia fimetaria CBS 119925]
MAHHHHARIHHLLPRQMTRPRPDEEEEEEEEEEERPRPPPPRPNREENVATVIETVVRSLPKTFDGDAVWVTEAPKTLIEPVVRPPRTTEEPDTPTPIQTSARPTPTGESDPEEETPSTTASPRTPASTLLVATSSPILGGLASSATGIASSTASPANETDAADSGGMSGGAKAGLALGILFVIGALLAGVLFLYRRKKNQADQQKADNEKSAFEFAAAPPKSAVVEPAPSIRTQRTLSTAPRLSLRPVTQFLPGFGENRKSGGNLLSVAAAAPAAAASHSLSPEHAASPWERPGAANAQGSPQNPFNDPVSRSNSPPQNPFEPHTASPASTAVLNEAPPAAAQPTGSQDFPTPAPANAAAAPVDAIPAALTPGPAPAPASAAPVVAAAVAAAAVPIAAAAASRNDMSPPQASPAWTEDLPASPGPAPTGPPPIAGAAGMAHPPAPNNVYRVQLDFKPSMHDELELHAGQVVRMLHEYDDGWALCVRMDRSHQGVVPRTCLSKHPIKPRNGPPRQGPPGPRMRGPPPNGHPMGPPHGHPMGPPNGRPMGPPRGPPMGSPNGQPMGPPMGPAAPRPLTPSSNGRNSPHPPALSPANGRMSPAPRSMSPGPRSMSPGPRNMPPMSLSPMGPGRPRAHSNAPYAGAPRSMSPGPYGGGPQHMPPPPKVGRPRSQSASQVMARRASPPGPSPMNPNSSGSAMPARKPVPGMAM